MAQTRCPRPECEHTFAIDEDLLGRQVSCPVCRRGFTSRPESLWLRNRRRESLVASGRLEWASPAREDDPRRQKKWMYHRASPDSCRPDLEADPMYETSIDRAQPTSRRSDFVVVLDDVRSRWNVGAIFRTADAIGVNRLVLAGITPTPPSKLIEKTALGAERSVPWIYRASILEALDELEEDGYEALALERTHDADTLFQAPAPGKKALVIGNEVAGVSAEALDRCSRTLAIPMAGTKGSLNVAVAFGIAGFQLARAH